MFSTLEDHPYNKPQEKTTKKITFARPYPSTPQMVIWLNSVDLANDKNVRVRAFATDIASDGFTLHLDTWSDSRLYSAGASWIAFPANKEGVTSGNFSTSDVRDPSKPQLQNKKAIKYTDAKKFKAAPQVLAGINAIDIDRSSNVRISVTSDGITNSGFTWHIDAWSDSVLYSAGAAYLAIDYPELPIAAKL